MDLHGVGGGVECGGGSAVEVETVVVVDVLIGVLQVGGGNVWTVGLAVHITTVSEIRFIVIQHAKKGWHDVELLRYGRIACNFAVVGGVDELDDGGATAKGLCLGGGYLRRDVVGYEDKNCVLIPRACSHLGKNTLQRHVGVGNTGLHFRAAGWNFVFVIVGDNKGVVRGEVEDGGEKRLAVR